MRRRFSEFGNRLFGRERSRQRDSKHGSISRHATFARRLRCEPLEDRRMLSASIDLPGAAVHTWNDGYDAHNLESSEWASQGGIVLGENDWIIFPGYSKPTYRFYVPSPWLGDDMSELTVRAYGHSGVIDGTEIIIAGQREGDVTYGYGYTTHTYSGSEARSLFSTDDNLGYYLDVTFEAITTNDWYDLCDVEITYLQASISETYLSHFQTAYSGCLALNGFYDFVDVYWDRSNWSHALLYKSTQHVLSFSNNLMGLASSELISATRSTVNALQDFYNLANLIPAAWDYALFWGYYDGLGRPSQSELMTQVNSARGAVRDVAHSWSDALADGTVSDIEKQDINSAIDLACVELTNTSSMIQVSANRMHFVLEADWTDG